ncbi:MAG: N-acetyltransferase [Kiritimatiellae bacterium]|nr:N-acetyltransferase [Kiritimatiellia bacterium]
MVIRNATITDLDDVLRVEREAFGEEDEARLVDDLLKDPSAQPALSLLAFDDGDNAVGHILFTRATLDPASNMSVVILAPLAVVPGSQRQGIGGALIKQGLEALRTTGVDLVFVLGHPGYYPRYGFEPAMKHGFTPTYAIPEKDADAWMVQALRAGALEEGQGRAVCADALDKPEYWRE